MSPGSGRERVAAESQRTCRQGGGELDSAREIARMQQRRNPGANSAISSAARKAFQIMCVCGDVANFVKSPCRNQLELRHKDYPQ